MASNMEKGYQQDDVPPPYSQDLHSNDTTLPSYNQTIANPGILSGPSCSLGYFPSQPVLQNWFIKGRAEPPPSYDSLFGRVKQARGDASGNLDFFKKFVFILIGTIGCTICIGLVMAIPVSMIAMGAVYLDDCRAERYIPIYLVVMGSFGVLKNFISLIQRFKNREQEQNDEDLKKKFNPFDTVLSCFMMAWFIAGNVWIYRLHGNYDGFDSSKSNFCDNTLYLYAFWMTTVTYILIASVCCCTCFGSIIASCLSNTTQ